MNIIFCSQFRAERMTPDADMACISITEPGQKDADLNGWEHLIRVRFHDVDESNFPSGWGFVSKNYTFFDAGMANEIIKFVERLPKTVDTLVIHCHAGISRSAAVSRALHDFLQVPIMNEGAYTLHNRHVYKVLMKEMYSYRCSGIEFVLPNPHD